MKKLLSAAIVLAMMCMPLTGLANGIKDVGFWSFEFLDLNMYFVPYDGLVPDFTPDTQDRGAEKTNPKKLFDAGDETAGVNVICSYEAYSDSAFKTFSDYATAFVDDMDAAFPDVPDEDKSEATTADFLGNDAFAFAFYTGGAAINVILIEAANKGVYPLIFIASVDNTTAFQQLLDCFYAYD